MEQSTTTKQIPKRILQGTVVSAGKMNKTVVVNVSRQKAHPKYKKRFIVSKRYLVHDEKNQCMLGDMVYFCQTRPLSRLKRWRFLRKST